MNWFKAFWGKLKHRPAIQEKDPSHSKPHFSSQVLQAQKEAERYHERFTPRAIQVLALARHEADRLNHNFVGTEHLLLSLIKLGEGVAFDVLRELGLELDIIAMEIVKQLGKGPEQIVIGNIPYTPRVNKVLSLAAKEANALNHNFLGTEHILLGLLREGDGVAGRILNNLDVHLESTRQAIRKEMDPNIAVGVSETEKFERFKVSLQNPPASPGIEETVPPEVLGHFTPRAVQVFALSRREASRLGHSVADTEHLLLGLIRLGAGVAVNILRQRGLDLENTRQAVEKLLGTGQDSLLPINIPFAPRVKKVIARAEIEAKSLNHSYVGTEHLLLGILHESDGPLARVFETFKLDPEETRQEILQELGQ